LVSSMSCVGLVVELHGHFYLLSFSGVVCYGIIFIAAISQAEALHRPHT